MTNASVVDPDESSPLFHRSIETSELLKKLRSIKEDETVTYDEFSKVAMGECKPGGIKYGYLASARNILQKETGIEFQAIPNVGLKRMNDSDKITKTKKALPTYNKKVKKDMRRLASTDYNTLSPDERLCHNVHMSILHVIKCSSGGDFQNKVEKQISNGGNERLALETTLKLFL